jgi:hypothetical protein
MWNQPRVALHELRAECSAPLQRITREILRLPMTEHTIAQIIDGLPTRECYVGPGDSISCKKHPDIASRAEPTEEATALASKFCSSIDIQAVTITAEVCYISRGKRECTT